MTYRQKILKSMLSKEVGIKIVKWIIAIIMFVFVAILNAISTISELIFLLFIFIISLMVNHSINYNAKWFLTNYTSGLLDKIAGWATIS